MKFFLIFTVGGIAGIIIAVNTTKEDLQHDINQLRRDKRMYDSLYRTANTRLLQFQDSVNRRCVCK
jgi:hypothetical protein